MIRRLLRIALLPSLVCPGAWADDPVGAEFQVNTFTTGVQEGATAAQAANGSFVVAWTSGRGNANQDGSYTGVFGQRFDASGAPQGSEFQVNSYTTGDQRGAAVAADASGTSSSCGRAANCGGPWSLARTGVPRASSASASTPPEFPREVSSRSTPTRPTLSV